MQHLINNIKAFYQKNRIIIIVGLGFLVLMQICSRGGRVEKQEPMPSPEIAQVTDDAEVKPLREIYYDDIQKQKVKRPEMTSMFILMGLVLLVYVAIKRGWLQKLTPSVVWVRVKIRRDKNTKERIASISIVNQTKESLTFSPPILVFSDVFKKSRKFRLKSGEGQNVFPLTLMPGTGHSIHLNIDAFKQKAGGLKGLNWIKVEVNASIKQYRSFWKFMF